MRLGNAPWETRAMLRPDSSPTKMLPRLSTAMPCGEVKCPGSSPACIFPSRANTSPLWLWMLTRGPIFGQSRLISP